MNERLDNREPIEPEIVPVTAIEAMERAQVDVQITTARKYPRDVTTFLRRAKTMIGEDPDLAAECGYELEKGGKQIIGPSIRLAEIALVAWGNARLQVIEEPPQAGDRFVRCHAIFHDLESNVAIRVPKIRRRTYSDGTIYNDDMTATVQNANVSVAYRDAIIRGIPRHFVKDLYRHAMKVAAGEVKDMATARTEFVQAWEAIGIAKERLFRGLEVEGPEGITLEHIGALRGLYARVKRGEVKASDVFRSVAEQPTEKKQGLADLAKAGEEPVAEKAAEKPARKKREPAPPPPQAHEPTPTPAEVKDLPKHPTPDPASPAPAPAEHSSHSSPAFWDLPQEKAEEAIRAMALPQIQVHVRSGAKAVGKEQAAKIRARFPLIVAEASGGAAAPIDEYRGLLLSLWFAISEPSQEG